MSVLTEMRDFLRLAEGDTVADVATVDVPEGAGLGLSGTEAIGALDAAFARLGQDARVYIIPDAGSVVPVLS